MVSQSHRITSLLEYEQPAEPRPALVRTEAQREASRRNGSQSRGPVTVGGKARSAMNALKHGLLARCVSPPTDMRGQDKLYRDIRRELIEELQPASFTHRTAVDVLARDYVQLARVAAMIEVLQRPTGLSDQDVTQFDELTDARRELKLVMHLVKVCETGEAMGFKSHAADALAGRVVRSVEQLESDMNPNDEDLTEAEMDQFERQQFRQQKEDWAKVRPIKKKLCDRQYLASVFRGERRMPARELSAVAIMLAPLASWLQSCIEEKKCSERRAIQAKENIVLLHAQAPQQLMLLQRYQAKIEREICRKLKRFDLR